MATSIIKDSLQSNLDALVSIKRGATSNGGSMSFTIPNNSRAFLVTSGGSASARGAYILSATSAGSLTSSDILQASGVALTFSTNTVTITNSSGVYINALLFLYQ